LATPLPLATGDTTLPGAAKHKVAAPVVLDTLPYVFLSFLLVLALLYARQAWRERRYQRAVQALVARTEHTTAAVTQFIEICMHYLNTPVAVLQGAHELLTTKQALPSDFLRNFGQHLGELKTTIQATQTSNQQALGDQVVASTVAQGGAIAETAGRTKKLGAALFGVALLIASLDGYLTLSGKYNLSAARLPNHVLLFVLGAGLVILSFWFRNRQQNLRSQVHQLEAQERALHQQKHQLLTTTAEQLHQHAQLLRTGTEGMGRLADAKLLLNGLAMLDKVAANLTKLTHFDAMPSETPLVPLSNFYVQQVAPSITEAANAKQVTITSNLPAQVNVQLSGEELEQVLQSVLKNAVEYSASGGKVELQATAARHGATIAVTDHGTGLSPEAQAGLFQPLSRGTDTKTFDHEGLGLDLYLDKLILEKHGGTITLKSAPSKGTKVSITVPSSSTSTGVATTLIRPGAIT
jgi:signal transduction histidine kinase